MRRTMSSQKQSVETIRHSLSHVLASSVKKLYPDVKFAIGPAIENGFYYDFEFAVPIAEADLAKIEKGMRELVRGDYKFVKRSLTKSEAIEALASTNQSYKIALADELEDRKITFYDIETADGKAIFTDMCSGPHIESTDELRSAGFKLDRLAGAYWRGDEKNKMLTRIYGLAFESQEELDQYIENRKEAEKRDHKKIGQELDLFSFHPEAPGMPFWHEKGMLLWNALEQFGKKLRSENGFVEIKTPILAKNSLWVKSGHWEHYQESMFHFELDKEIYCLKPMDCPFNIKIYQTKPRSYKELPIRFTEIGHCHRHEKSGELNGLLRVQEITQDDSHIFMTDGQVKSEIKALLKMVTEYYKALSLKPKFFLSTRPEDFMGEIPTWDKAERELQETLEENHLDYEVKDKDGAFYGPKIDVDIKDALGRSWQVATIQLDFQLAGKFDCEYIDDKGEKKTPVMIHAAIFGSFERMIGILLEHTAGNLPVWLAPVQAIVLPIADRHNEYAEKIRKELEAQDVRVSLDVRTESVGKKIREAEMQKIPYMLVIGDKEIEADKVAVRKYGEGDKGQLGVSDLIKDIFKN